MNINRLIKKVRYKCGLNGILKGVVSDDELFDIIDLFTRETFSRYFKHIFVIENMIFNENNRSKHNKNEYILPDKLINMLNQGDIEISGIRDIEKVKEGEGILVGDNLAMLPAGHSGPGYLGNRFIGAAYHKIKQDIYRSPLEAEFKSPYSIQIKKEYYEISNNVYKVELYSSHPKNLSTIKDSYAETFEELAVLDVQSNLWNNVVEYVNQLDIGFSQIDLKKEDWDQADDKRQQMIDEFEESFIADFPTVLVV